LDGRPPPGTRQERAVTKIESFGGRIERDKTDPERAVVGVDLQYSGSDTQAPILDAALKPLKDLPSLQTLDLSGNLVTDAGLESLRDLTSLRTVVCRNTEITDEGIERLKEALPSVEIIR
jgi:hypothetical protein